MYEYSQETGSLLTLLCPLQFQQMQTLNLKSICGCLITLRELFQQVAQVEGHSRMLEMLPPGVMAVFGPALESMSMCDASMSFASPPSERSKTKMPNATITTTAGVAKDWPTNTKTPPHLGMSTLLIVLPLDTQTVFVESGICGLK